MTVPVFRTSTDGHGLNQTHLGVVAVHAAVNAKIVQGSNTGTLLGVHNVHEAVGVIREKRSRNGEEANEEDDDRSNDGCLVLAEANPCILHVADGLIIELGIGQTLVNVYKRKLLRRNGLHILVRHYFSPILIRGSINP